MECCIPALPTSVNTTFIVYRWGAEGYNSKPGGARYTLIHREDDYLVPVKEIESVLDFLDLPRDHFWSIEDHTSVAAAITVPASSASTGRCAAPAALEVETIPRPDFRKRNNS
jgi:hypothetical protein